MQKKRLLFTGEASFLSTGFATYNREIIKRLHATGKYEIAEMGSYARDGDPRISSLPWKFYPVLPSNQKEKQIFDSNPVNQFGKYKIDAVLADFQPDITFDCVPPGELIYTENGYRPVEDIRSGDRVLTHTGQFRKVNSSWFKEYDGKLINIHVAGNREPLRVTPNHPVYVFRKRNQTNKKKSWTDIYSGVTPEFVKASEVKPGDLVTLPGLNMAEKQCQLRISNFIDDFVLDSSRLRPKTHGKFINDCIEVDEDFARLIGYVLGDGYINTGGLQITFGEDEIEFISDALNLIYKVFGVEAYSRPYVDKKAVDVVIHSRIISSFLQKYLADNHIPKEIFYSSKSIKEQMIAGLIRSDGCYKRRTVAFANKKRHLIYEYRAICTSLGIPTNITYSNKNGEKFYEVSTFGVESETVSSIAQKYTYNLQNATITKSSRQARVTQMINGFLVSSVRKVIEEDYLGRVCNFEVDVDNSYCVQSFCTHNCRDPWMIEHLVATRFRDNYKLVLMPTVDSAPQKKEWIDGIFMKADVVTAYSRYGKRVLEQEGVKVEAVTSPGVHLDVFKPLDKVATRDKFHLTPSLLIFGTVMRNQKRKLFPDLFDAYRRLRNRAAKRPAVERAKKKIKANKELPKNKRRDLTKEEKLALRIEHSVLYCHTSWPDLGWDIPRYIGRYQLQRHIVFTYLCDSCGEVYANWFTPCDKQGKSVCRVCGKHTAHMPTTHAGITEEKLIEVFNLFDVYVQPAICEGWGLPIMESKACGVPGIYQNYSAMEDHVENGGGEPIKIDRFYHESETSAIRSLPDVDDLSRKMEKFAANDKYRNRKATEARECAVKMHDWDVSAEKLEKIFDELELPDRKDTWDLPPKFEFVTPERPPKNISDQDFVHWCYINILHRTPDGQGMQDWLNSIKGGQGRDEIEGYFRQLTATNNRFEELRWMNSLKNRGMPQEIKGITLEEDVMPGLLV